MCNTVFFSTQLVRSELFSLFPLRWAVKLFLSPNSGFRQCYNIVFPLAYYLPLPRPLPRPPSKARSLLASISLTNYSQHIIFVRHYWIHWTVRKFARSYLKGFLLEQTDFFERQSEGRKKGERKTKNYQRDSAKKKWTQTSIYFLPSGAFYLFIIQLRRAQHQRIPSWQQIHNDSTGRAVYWVWVPGNQP